MPQQAIRGSCYVSSHPLQSWPPKRKTDSRPQLYQTTEGMPDQALQGLILWPRDAGSWGALLHTNG